jgi:2'-5' RNA ligase
MFYAIIICPELDNSKFDQFRAKYDPLHPWVKPHITLVYPFDFNGDLAELEKHIEEVISKWRPFEVELKGIEKAWDHFILLKTTEGRGKIIKLHEDLYTGMLNEFLSKEYIYNPHLTIGLGTEENADEIFAEAENLNLSYKTKVTEVVLSSIDGDKKEVIYEKVFKLEE